MSGPDETTAGHRGGAPVQRDAHVQGDAHVQVVRGTPDDVELAALVAGLVAAASGQDDDGDAHGRARRDAAGAARARWTAPGRLRGTGPRTPGPDAWRWSLHP